MCVLFINQVYWPDVAATAQHADALARHGHKVHVIANPEVPPSDRPRAHERSRAR